MTEEIQTVKDLVFRKSCDSYKEEHRCNPPYDVQRTYFIGASIAEEAFYIGYQKGLSDAYKNHKNRDI